MKALLPLVLLLAGCSAGTTTVYVPSAPEACVLALDSFNEVVNDLLDGIAVGDTTLTEATKVSAAQGEAFEAECREAVIGS